MKRDFESLGATTYDLIVVGGGIMGSGIARDAALRGIRTLLLEKDDFSSGTTSRSSRLIHGGLRYLRQMELGLVRQDMREREVLLRMAPHLVRPLRFIVPVTRPMDRVALPLGMLLYDLLSFDKSLPGRRRVSNRDIGDLEPDLELEGIAGAYLYSDCQVSLTERLCIENVLSAVHSGATAMNHARVTGLVRNGASVSGVHVRDALSGRQYRALGRITINATGHWADEIEQTTGADSRPRVRRTRGAHLVTRRLSTNAIASLSRTDNRLFFVIPWQGFSLIGTTDTDFDGDPDVVYADAADVSYLLASAGTLFPSLKKDDILYAMAGLRTLVGGGGGNSSDVSRSHRLVDHESADGIDGFISLLGGKITGYRAIAQQTVDLVSRKLRLQAPCRTAEEPLPGAPAVTEEEIERAARENGVTESVAAHLAGLYGSRFGEVLRLAAEDARGNQLLCSHCPDIVAQVWHAVTEEGALTVSDFLLRRSVVGLGPCQGLDAAETVADEMGRLLGWDSGECRRQVAVYRESARLGQVFREDPTPAE
jgi:glycerol-3-phosphate dehydrogenase